MCNEWIELRPVLNRKYLRYRHVIACLGTQAVHRFRGKRHQHLPKGKSAAASSIAGSDIFRIFIDSILDPNTRKRFYTSPALNALAWFLSALGSGWQPEGEQGRNTSVPLHGVA